LENVVRSKKGKNGTGKKTRDENKAEKGKRRPNLQDIFRKRREREKKRKKGAKQGND